MLVLFLVGLFLLVSDLLLMAFLVARDTEWREERIHEQVEGSLTNLEQLFREQGQRRSRAA